MRLEQCRQEGRATSRLNTVLNQNFTGGSRAVDGTMTEAGHAKMMVRRPGQIAQAPAQKERTWTNFWKSNQRMAQEN